MRSILTVKNAVELIGEFTHICLQVVEAAPKGSGDEIQIWGKESREE